MFNVILFIGAICGLAMVIGSMLLLWKGNITLHEASSRDAGLSIELVKEIKVTTRNPALGLFLIGLVFFVSSALIAQEGAIEKFELSGAIESLDELVGVEVHLIAGPWKRDVLDSRGIVSEIYHPNVKKLRVKVVAPGYEFSGIGREIEVKSGKASLGKINIGRRSVEEIDTQPNSKPSQRPTDGASNTSGGHY